MTDDLPIAHILVMEDEAAIRILVAKALRRSGYEVWEAADGAETVEQFSRLPEETRDRCLLLLDLEVPNGMGGGKTLAEIRKIAPGVRAIFASGLADDEALEEMKESGRTEILTKPFTVKELNAAVDAMR